MFYLSYLLPFIFPPQTLSSSQPVPHFHVLVFVNQWVSLELLTGAWVRDHSQEHGWEAIHRSTENLSVATALKRILSLSNMQASGNTQSRLGRTIRRVCATVSFCSCNKTSEINQLVKMKRCFGSQFWGLLTLGCWPCCFLTLWWQSISLWEWKTEEVSQFMVARKQRKRGRRRDHNISFEDLSPVPHILKVPHLTIS